MPGGWFYNDVSGVVRYDTGAAYYSDLLARALGTGWHGPYKTEKLADSHAGITGAQAINSSNPLTAAGNALKNAAAQNIPGAQQAEDVGSFLHRLVEPQTWTRVGEVALGGILVYAGIRALTRGSITAGAATKPVRKVASGVAKVAAPEIRLASRTAAKKAAPKTTARVAAHRATVAKYGAKKPYRPPTPRQPTVRISHIHHHKHPTTKRPVKP